MNKIWISMLALLLALPTFAQKDKDHDFKVAKTWMFSMPSIKLGYDVCRYTQCG